MQSYAKSLLGIPYRWWNPTVSCCENTGPFWASEGGEVPLEEIQRGQLCCAGLLNVICRKFGIAIPGAKERHFYAGGTWMWWNFFEQKGLLQVYDPEKIYPAGSLLLRPYASEEDQGHIAIVLDDGIIHSWPEKGVVIEEPVKEYYQKVVVGFLKN